MSAPKDSDEKTHGNPNAVRRAEEHATLLGEDSSSDDDFFLTGPGRPDFVRLDMATRSGQDSKTAALKGQVAEVAKVMRSNVERLMERGDRLDDLQERSDRLDESSDRFRTGAGRVRRKAWWDNMKMKLIIGSVIAVVIIIIIIVASSGAEYQTNEGENGGVNMP